MKSQMLNSNHRRSHRRGITLLEILLSLAVAVVGIFGVLVLIPISARMAETGLKLDEAGALGRSALHQFEVRNMRNPSNWAIINPSNPTAGGGGPNFVPVTVQANKSYCIDPEFMARNLTQVSPAAFNVSGAWFPINSSGTLIPPTPMQPLWLTPLPSMHRISLGSGSPFAPVMTEALAREIFSSLDDLTIDSPSDTTNPAFQHFHGEERFNPNAPNPIVLSKRQSGGEKSWLAILTPRPSVTGLPESDLYTLYIVVYDARDSNLSSEVDVNSGNRIGDLERWSRVNFIGGGLGGGEVLLTATDPTNGGPGGIRELDVNRDEWMMVCQRVRANRFNNGMQQEQVYDMFRWYRVADVDELDISGTAPTRFVSLDGPDWTTPQNTAGGGVTFEAIFGVNVKGVLEVYERTVRLENRSIWTE